VLHLDFNLPLCLYFWGLGLVAVALAIVDVGMHLLVMEALQRGREWLHLRCVIHLLFRALYATVSS
jgi:hypothetical protein